MAEAIARFMWILYARKASDLKPVRLSWWAVLLCSVNAKR